MSWRSLFTRHDTGPLAIALAGGGSRASFQIGALEYLYDEENLKPEIFTGTSAGAILASALAQYSDADEQRKTLTQVEEIWSGMESSEEMFSERPWFSKLRTHLPMWMKVVSLRQESQRTSLAQSIQTAVVDIFSRENSEKTISPLQTLTTLWEGARATTDLQQIIRGFGSETSAFEPGPMVQELLAPHIFDPTRLRASSTQLRISVVALESGRLRYVSSDGRMYDEEGHLLIQEEIDFVDAITASCAIPGVFPPVNLAGEHYVDGGIRANLPTEMAYTMGAGRVIAIVSGAKGPSEEESFANSDLLEVVMRAAAGIMPDELENLQIRLAKARGATVIEPVIDVHDALTVDPGLISIAKDYGWMRAHDVMTDASAKASQLTHEIINMRRHLWAIEDKLFAPDADAPEAIEPELEKLWELKGHLRSLLDRVEPKALPRGADQWWQTWEKHPYPINA